MRDIWAGYDARPVLEGIDLQVPKGSITGIIGPNGGGKSSLLKLMLGLIRPWRGNVLVLGRSPNQARSAVGYVPQVEAVDWQFPVTVADVVLMGRTAKLGLFRRPGSRDRKLTMECLDCVGMAELANRQIGQLSGGQQQRTFLARALVQEPEVLLLDEPVSGVDASSQHAIFEVLDSLRDRGKVILIATHDLSCVAERFDKVLCLNRRVIAYGDPATVFTEEILGRTYESHLFLLGGQEGVHAIDVGHNCV